MTEPFEVDSWRFMPPRLAGLLKGRAESEPAAVSIPFTPLSDPIAAGPWDWSRE
jgi:hypothetical protein